MSQEDDSPPRTTAPSFPEQNADGIDLSLIRRSLAMSPTERLRQAESHLRDYRWIRLHARRVS